MAIVHGKDIGADILEAMGLESYNVSEVTIRIAVGDVVEATVKRFIDKDEMTGLEEELRQVMESYEMRPKDLTGK